MLRTFPASRATMLQAATAMIVALLALTGCADKKQQRNRPAIPVVVTTVKRVDVPYTIEANGVVMPVQAANVASQVAGIVRRVAFQEGQEVAKGQVLFEIDPRPYQAAYQQALAALARDRATAANAARDAQRYATLAQQDYVTKEQADQTRATAEAQHATVAADEAAVANARFNLDNTTIRAPISGRTGALLVREGNLVSANGNTPLVTINQISPILVRFAIPSTQLPLLQRYGTAGGLVVSATPNTGTNTMVDSSANAPIGLSVEQGDPDAGATGAEAGPLATPASSSPSPQLTALSQPEHGSLFFIDNAVDTTTGTVQLKASFPNPNRRLWVGEFVATRLELFTEQNALVVPASAVVTGQQGQYVYVVSDSMTAQQRPVRVERTAGSMMVIASGLREGERVVTDGQSRLTPNSKVVINTPQGAPAGGSRRGGAGGAGAPGAGGGRRGGAGAAGAGGAAGNGKAGAGGP